MLIHECKPRVAASGNLRFSTPGFSRSEGEITPWQAGFDLRQIRNGRAARSQLWSLVLFPARPARRLPDEVEAFVQQIPAPVRERVKRFEFGQSLMLQCLARSTQADDLSISHPTLFWLMITAVYYGKIEPDRVCSLSRSKQVDILGNILRTASRASLRLLRRVDFGQGRLSDAHALVDALADADIVRMAGHQRNVSVRLLRALAKYPDLLHPSIVALLGGDAGDDRPDPLFDVKDLADTVRDIGRMAHTLRIERPDQALSRCRSREDIDRLHDRWVRRMNRAGVPAPPPTGRRNARVDLDQPPGRRRAQPAINCETSTHIRFPPPPWPGNEDIEPICSIEELIEEGRVQSNCVASYAPAIGRKLTYVYRVLRPERGTLELVRRSGQWRMGQLLLARNRKPGRDAVAEVTDWFLSNSDPGPQD